ncbi:hypothetical protein [Brachybacterium aquaticum]|uniref:Uncharacterized protein n=1 Tax=Brachybacterium aquaticum TaxID=1432564 RepID=A0A841AHM1_9MICO|nr:hypothetical protein [Brachybacterium aquaticum]MBB5832825.1 hypothetical protein [Brachybacterium aquaticum]
MSDPQAVSDAQSSTAAPASRAATEGAPSAEPAGAPAPEVDAASQAGEATAPQTLSSLSSLLGGSFAGGQACAADGTCD